MIRGTLHLVEDGAEKAHRGTSKDLARVEFVDRDPEMVIGLLEAVLATLHARYEAQKDRPAEAKPEAPRQLTGRQRRGRLIEDEDDDEDED